MPAASSRWMRRPVSSELRSDRFVERKPGGRTSPPNGGTVMKATHWIIAAAALTFVQPASAAQSDPEIVLYRFPGVRDDGAAANVGVATVFHCTNFSGTVENIRFVTRTFDGAIKFNDVTNIPHLFTRTATTHPVAAYVGDVNMNTGNVNQG